MVVAVGGDTLPVLLGLCEVENDSAMIALTRRGSLRALGYDYVMTDSPDERGVTLVFISGGFGNPPERAY